MALLADLPRDVASSLARKAHTILCCTHDSASWFYELFRMMRTGRDAKGTATDEEYDLVRAMLVFAAAGLDSMVKQLVKDALPAVIEEDVGARNHFHQFIKRKLQKEDPKDWASFLTNVLTAHDSKKALTEVLITSLTESGLQSSRELSRVAAHFNIRFKDLGVVPTELQDIFDVRNHIIHEMDVDFDLPTRTRKTRPHEKMKGYAEQLLRVAEAFLTLVDKKLQ